jgi:regulatory protein
MWKAHSRFLFLWCLLRSFVAAFFHHFNVSAMTMDTSPHQAPQIITAITAQKKNPSRCSVFVNGEFAFGCTIDTTVRFGLTKGRELTQRDKEQLEAQEDIIALKQTALRYAIYKSRTAQEVRHKMTEKEFAPEEADYAVQFLEEFGYVNDRLYAKVFIQEMMKRKPAGEIRLRQELAKRGISKHDITDALAEAFPAETARDMAFDSAMTAAQKKMHTLGHKTPEKRKQALVSYLQRQGFSWKVIKKVLPSVMEADSGEADMED